LRLQDVRLCLSHETAPVANGDAQQPMSTHLNTTHASDEVTFLELWDALWKGAWLIAASVGLAGIAAVLYALTATEWYTAEVVLSPAEKVDPQGLLRQLGGLASLTGVALRPNNNNEALAILRSRDFTRTFIEGEELLTILFADEWDEKAGRWEASDPEDQPDVRDAVRYFDRTVRTITENRATGLVTVAIEWKDADTAARWANSLVDRVNEHTRQRALREAEANVEYLQSELGTTNLVALQQSIGSLLENELQKLMLARGNKEFAFKIIDRAEPPKLRSRPKRTQIVLLTVAVVGVLAAASVLVVHVVRRA
jgi:LPS O-antigen subunit length determinant protein (WzzB/FepE family)